MTCCGLAQTTDGIHISNDDGWKGMSVKHYGIGADRQLRIISQITRGSKEIRVGIINNRRPPTRMSLMKRSHTGVPHRKEDWDQTVKQLEPKQWAA